MPRDTAPAPEEATLWQGGPSQWVNVVPFALCVLILPIPYAVYRWLAVRTTRYTITSQRLRKARGILNRHYDDLELYRVKDITITCSIFERLAGLGSLHLVTSDATTPRLTLPAIAGPHAVHATLRREVEARRRERGVREMDIYGDEGSALTIG